MYDSQRYPALDLIPTLVSGKGLAGQGEGCRRERLGPTGVRATVPETIMLV